MKREGFQEYLVWRHDRLERRYAQHTRSVRRTGLATFVAILLFAAGTYYAVQQGALSTRLHAYAGISLGLFALVSFLAHVDARRRRDDVEEELDVIEALPFFRSSPLYRTALGGTQEAPQRGPIAPVAPSSPSAPAAPAAPATHPRETEPQEARPIDGPYA